MKKLAIILLSITLASCASFHPTPKQKACMWAGAATGAIVVGGGVVGGILGAECKPACVERKIAHGESIHEAVQHHVNRRDDAILYGALPSAIVGAAIGAWIGYEYCKDEPQKDDILGK